MSEFSNDMVRRINAARGQKSTGTAKKVKLGRRLTKIAGSRAFLRLLASPDPTPIRLVTMQAVWEYDDELQVLDGARSIGDALCGNPEAAKPDSRGLGMARRPGGRELIADRENLELALQCLFVAGYSAQTLAEMAGKVSVTQFEAWYWTVPSRDAVLAALAAPETPPPPATTPPTPPTVAVAEPDEESEVPQEVDPEEVEAVLRSLGELD